MDPWFSCLNIFITTLVRDFAIALTFFMAEVCPYHIETSQLIFRSNQWIGVYMIETSVMKEWNTKSFFIINLSMYKKSIWTSNISFPPYIFLFSLRLLEKYYLCGCFKELWNCILRIILVWSLLHLPVTQKSFQLPFFFSFFSSQQQIWTDWHELLL